ncbi:hypothetical protein [Legionella parisiensis]|uniref:Uncharacterized protein n=1 Tax=Legionella parisiensis TaxID=45071 RepID=A0A1E5JUW4_9GAMM|nr:hypothetical protein [Legionella parisiensis]OEH48309.1 hypothetical protein lpari_00564 [Legionella parisiensis]STX76605.1 sensory box histidine kinase/response regulator [Legionella parisiensis]
MIEQEMSKGIKTPEKAYVTGEWETIEKIVHKMKIGSVYCGAYK